MTRKDYELIAEAIKSAYDAIDHKADGGVMQMWGVEKAAQSIAWALTDSNTRFDRDRFIKACGVS